MQNQHEHVEVLFEKSHAGQTYKLHCHC